MMSDKLTRFRVEANRNIYPSSRRDISRHGKVGGNKNVTIIMPCWLSLNKTTLKR